MNEVVIIGRLTKDNNLSQVGNYTVLKNTIATTSKSANKEKTTFIDITAWGKIAESINAFTVKGNQIAIKGRLESENWIDKYSDKKRSKVILVVEKVKFLFNSKKQVQDEIQATFERTNETVEENDLPFY